MIFDNDFTTVPFMHSQENPSNGGALIKSSTELVTEKDYLFVNFWYEYSIVENDVNEDIYDS